MPWLGWFPLTQRKSSHKFGVSLDTNPTDILPLTTPYWLDATLFFSLLDGLASQKKTFDMPLPTHLFVWLYQIIWGCFNIYVNLGWVSGTKAGNLSRVIPVERSGGGTWSPRTTYPRSTLVPLLSWSTLDKQVGVLFLSLLLCCSVVLALSLPSLTVHFVFFSFYTIPSLP